MLQDKKLAKKESFRKVGVEKDAHIIVHCRKVRCMPRLISSSSSDGGVVVTRQKSLHIPSSSSSDEVARPAGLQIYLRPSDSESLPSDSSYETTSLEEID